MEIEEYKLIFTGKTQSEITFTLDSVSESEKARKKENRKVYVIKNGEKFLYVGEAHCSIDTRLKRGFTPYRYFIRNGIKRRGYQGYKWIQLSEARVRPELSVYVIVLEEKYDKFRGFAEAVEGELVYLIRLQTGAWPEFQNEIHFNNNALSIDYAKACFEIMQLKSI